MGTYARVCACFGAGVRVQTGLLAFLLLQVLLQPGEKGVPRPFDLCWGPSTKDLVQERSEHLTHLLREAKTNKKSDEKYLVDRCICFSPTPSRPWSIIRLCRTTRQGFIHDTRFHWSAPSIYHSNWSDSATESDSGLEPLPTLPAVNRALTRCWLEHSLIDSFTRSMLNLTVPDTTVWQTDRQKDGWTDRFGGWLADKQGQI